MRRIRVFFDGLEFDDLDPRTGGVLDLTEVPLWPLEELRIELDRYPENVLRFAQTHLLRGLNQVVASLDEARECVEAALPAAATAQKRAG